jgi:hypothetical protein
MHFQFQRHLIIDLCFWRNEQTYFRPSHSLWPSTSIMDEAFWK